jgi:uncharacterized coiled-coil protein SlyX
MKRLTPEWFRWIVGGLLGSLVMVGSWAFVSVETRVANIETALTPRAERLATLETLANTQQRQMDRLEDKLDWLIDKEVNRGSDRGTPPPGRRLRQQP